MLCSLSAAQSECPSRLPSGGWLQHPSLDKPQVSKSRIHRRWSGILLAPLPFFSANLLSSYHKILCQESVETLSCNIFFRSLYMQSHGPDIITVCDEKHETKFEGLISTPVSDSHSPQMTNAWAWAPLFVGSSLCLLLTGTRPLCSCWFQLEEEVLDHLEIKTSTHETIYGEKE